MKNILVVFVLIFSSFSWSESWTIGKTLKVEPSNIDVTFQVFPDYDPSEKLIHGWKGEDLYYLVIVDRQPGGKNIKRYWKGMLKELKKSSDNRKITVESEGNYTDAANSEVSYKLLSWVSDGDHTTQMYNLITGKSNSYWVIGTPLTNDVDYMVSQIKSLLATSTIVE